MPLSSISIPLPLAPLPLPPTSNYPPPPPPSRPLLLLSLTTPRRLTRAPVSRTRAAAASDMAETASSPTLLEFMGQAGAADDLVVLVAHIQSACKRIAALVASPGNVELSRAKGGGGEVAAGRDAPKPLDELSNEIILSSLQRSGKVAVMASEENDLPIWVSNDGPYVVVTDPLDGSRNIEVSIPTGTIFGIYNRLPELDHLPEEERAQLNSLQSGTHLVASGYVLYSSATILCVSFGAGTHGFTLDQSTGEFVLTHPSIQIPPRGQIYSVNDARYFDWPEGLRKYIDTIRQGKGQHPKKYSARYVCSLVADFHRTLIYGGVAMNPRDHLRLVYEANPLSFLAEQAGGRGSDGKNRILSIQPVKLHQRLPLFLGSMEDMLELESYGDVQQKVNPGYENGTPGDLAVLLSHVQSACIRIAALVASPPPSRPNAPKLLDEMSSEIILSSVQSSEKAAVLASKNNMFPVWISNDAPYVVVTDPLDEPRNIEASMPTGTIFGIYKLEKAQLNAMQNETKLVAAGYVLYSSATFLSISFGAGTHGFTLDQSTREFVLSHPSIQIPPRGKMYSVNDARYFDWPEALKNYIDTIRQGKGQHPKKYTSRFVCSLVADFHRTLIYGGVAMNPRDYFQLVFKANPLSFLAEQAGGRGSDGKKRILSIKPVQLQLKLPLFLGSMEDIVELESYGNVQQKVQMTLQDMRSGQVQTERDINGLNQPMQGP
uniref:fructose-bisphosphatase n=1 Tax=Leersia perrieri TaxID=77586 RepID=A0A0D9WSZ1_9ORYZ